MGIYRDPGGFIGTYRNLYGPLEIYGDPRGPVGTSRDLWGPVATYNIGGDLGVFIETYGDLCGVYVAPMGTYRELWRPITDYADQWGPMGIYRDT